MKKMNVIALIVLLTLQTMIAPISAMATGGEAEPNPAALEDQNDVKEADLNEEESTLVVEEPVEEKEQENLISPLQYRDPIEITENIIDEIILLRKDGEEYVPIEDGELIDPDEDLKLEMNWSLPEDPVYIGGDTFTFNLPDQLNIYSDITGNLDGFGTFVVTMDGKVTFTFNSEIDNNSKVHGTFWVETELRKENIKTSEDILEFILSEEVTEKITINVKPESGQAVTKNGQPVDGNFNTEEILWTVLINTTRDSLENAIITDPILAGQELDTSSIVLKEIEVNLAGEKVGEIGDATGFVDHSTAELLKLELGNTNKAYELSFKTKMKEEEKDKEGWHGYENTVYLNADGKDEKQAGASVSVQRPESLVKTSNNFNAGDRSVSWEVKANFTQKELKAGDTITDEFTFTAGGVVVNDVFELVENEIVIERVTAFDNNGNAIEKSDAKALFDIHIDGNKVTYTLKENTSDAFVIKYKTKVKDGAYIHKDGVIRNEVTIDGKTKESTQFVPQQVGVKKNNGINYENKTINWIINVNTDKQDLRNFVVTDDFSGSGQKLLVDSMKVMSNGSDVTSSVTIIPRPDGEGFTIEFGDITESYTIMYQTKFTYDFGKEGVKPNFKNDVKITYSIGDGSDYELDIEDTVKPNNNTKNNGVKNGKANNETKEITWTVDVNYNNLKLTDAKVIDEIAPNQSLVPGSVKIYETTIKSGGGITKGADVTDDFSIIAEENLVEVLFSGEINQSYRIEFVTVDKDGIYNSDEVYKNTAQFIPREGEQHLLTASVTLPNQGQFLGKKGLHNKEDWTADWKIDVNQSKSKLTDVTVTDDLGDANLQILLADTIKVTKAGSNENLEEGVDYTLNVSGNKFTVKFKDEITEAYEITYSSYIIAEETASISNTAKITAGETIIGTVDKVEEILIKISTGGGTAVGETGNLVLHKTETETGRILEGIKFTLQKEIFGETITVRTGETNAEGNISWSGLKYGDYTLIEEIPEGYKGEKVRTVTISAATADEGTKVLEIKNERLKGIAKIVKKDATTDEVLAGAKFKITNIVTGQVYELTTGKNGEISEKVPFGEYTVEEIVAPSGYRVTKNIENVTIEIDKTATITVVNEAIVEVAGQKTWHHDKDKEGPQEITVELYKDGVKADEQTVTQAKDWKYSFENLDKYDEDGKEINYTIKEVDVDGYISNQDGYDLINIQKIDISGIKTWDEVDPQYRPDSIKVKLFADGKEVRSQTVKGQADHDDWAFTFKDLPKYTNDGAEIDYTLEEVKLPGYTTEVNNEEYKIINKQKTTEVSGTKTWLDDESEERPTSIIVQVKNGNTVVKEKEITAKDDWAYTFKDLPKYDRKGAEISYTVDEKDVPEGYVRTFDKANQHNIINTRTGETSINITKAWKDENKSDRPDVIKVNLLQNGDFYKTYEVTAENDWVLEITNLDAFDAEGKAYVYTVKEQDVPGYASNVDGFDIVNTRTAKKDIEITKTWVDQDSTNRPDEIVVELFRSIVDGDKELVDTFTVTAEDDWLIEVKDLPSFDDDGKAYTYEIKEKAVEGYNTVINGYDITNTEKTYAIGDYVWVDRNKDGIQDDYEEVLADVKVELFDKDGNKLAETKTDKDGLYIFDELRAGDYKVKFTLTKEQAKQYKFTKQNAGEDTTVDSDADPVTGWTTEFRLDDDNEYLTMDYTDQVFKATQGIDPTWDAGVIELVQISGTKTWVETEFAIRPESITVELLQNGKKIAEVEVTADTDWKYQFTDLDAYDENGIAYTYTVAEQKVEGYTTTIEGYDITNTSEETFVLGESGEVEKGEVLGAGGEAPEGEVLGAGGELPRTATNIYNLALIGLGFMFAGTLVFFVRRKKLNH